MSPERRARIATRIIDQPWRYVLCVSCDAILPREKLNAQDARLCCMCHGYRFEEREDLITAQAQRAGSAVSTQPDICAGDFD